MTEFVGVRNMMRWIAATGVDTIIHGLIEELDRDFQRWESFELVPRSASHSPVGVIELMPISDDETYSFKYVNGHPNNPMFGYQTVTAFGALAEVHTGYPVFLAEMTMLTALRTAATSALAARALARSNSKVLAMIGTGSQAEFQALAFKDALGIETLQIYDTDPDAIAKFVRNMRPLGFEITVTEHAADAAEGADIVTTCTADKVHGIVIADVDVKPGVHLNSIGGDCPGKTELDPETLDRATVFVEYEPQTRKEGEIQLQAPDFPVTELWRVLTGKSPGRISDDQITVFDSVGFAIEDFAALNYLRNAVRGSDYVDDIDLVAEPDDPKDLFGFANSLFPVG